MCLTVISDSFRVLYKLICLFLRRRYSVPHNFKTVIKTYKYRPTEKLVTTIKEGTIKKKTYNKKSYFLLL